MTDLPYLALALGWAFLLWYANQRGLRNEKMSKLGNELLRKAEQLTAGDQHLLAFNRRLTALEAEALRIAYRNAHMTTWSRFTLWFCSTFHLYIRCMPEDLHDCQCKKYLK